MLEFLKGIAYTAVLGKPLVVWMGLLALLLFLSAAILNFFIKYRGVRAPAGWAAPSRLAVAGLIVAIIHGILALSIYL
ncbi:MAG: hypothetical protein AB1657_03135 [Candidatus Micrarchaeota archaeon]